MNRIRKSNHKEQSKKGRTKTTVGDAAKRFKYSEPQPCQRGVFMSSVRAVETSMVNEISGVYGCGGVCPAAR